MELTNFIILLGISSLLFARIVGGLVIDGTPEVLGFPENSSDISWPLEVTGYTSGDDLNYFIKAPTSVDTSDDPNMWKKFKIMKVNASISRLQQDHAFDYEVVKERKGSFIIVANKSNALTEETINVILKDINDNVPRFKNLPASVNVSEATGVGASVFTIEGEDLDGSDNFKKITFSFIDGNNDGYFKLEFKSPSSAHVRVNSVLDHDSGNYVYNLTINATDAWEAVVNPNPLWSVSYLVITITDVDDSGAAFTKTVYGPITIAENLAPGSLVTQVTAYDKDRTLKHPISYHLIQESDPNGMFAMDSASGNITLVNKLDGTKQSSYALLVSANTSSHDPVYAQVLIVLEDANTHQPNFTSAVYTSQIAENAQPGTLVLVVEATDADEGNNTLVSYSLEGVNNQLFIIETVNSLGYIYLNGTLDYDVENVYNFTVFATETFTTEKYSDSSLVVINVTEVLANENNPVFAQSGYFPNITEEETGGHVVQVTATDPDKENYGRITYSIVDGSYGMFSIDDSTGWINNTGPLNREVKDAYVLLVRASDGDTIARTSDVLVVVSVLDANDNSPTFLKTSYSAAVVENSNIGNTVLAVQAKDADEGVNAKFDFSVIGGEGKFSVVGDGNAGYVLVNGSLDYETETSYTFTVVATESSTLERNKGNTSITITVIDVNDNSPVFSSVSGYSGSVAENSENGTSVLTVNATDTDTGLFGEVTYSLVTESVPFAINSSSGKITTDGNLDRETKESYSLTVKAEDGGKPSLSSYVNVIIKVTDVNDNMPKFSKDPYVVTIDEDMSVGSSVITVEATDVDEGQNSLLRYYLQGENGLFEVDENGVIRVNGTLDYETNTTYTLLVFAEESSTAESWQTWSNVIIHLNDVNEFDPEFSRPSYYATIEENKAPNSTVVTVQASDNDGVYNDISYNIVSGDDNGYFVIDKTSGVISTTISFDRETTETFILKVQASDNGSPNRTTETFVVIDVLDTNDNSPFFSKSLYNTTIPENLPVGTTVLAVKATDRDVNSTNSDIRYFVEGADSKFDVTPSGHVFVNGTLDFESKETYSFTIFAEESSTAAKQQHNASVFITVTDVNEYDPVFTQSGFYGNFSEDAAIGTPGVQISASDLDRQYNVITYQVIHGNDNGMFSINSSTGIISTAAALDHETDDQFTLTVRAQDDGSPARSAEVTVTIDVLDVNDNMPMFLQSSYSGTVFENVEIGATVLVVKAEDKDEGENAKFYYYIDGGDGKFGVSSDGGIVTLATLDYEDKTMYSFKVFANDTNSSGTGKANTTVTVTVKDVNEFNPVFSNDRYSANVSEDSIVGTTVIQVAASDDDGVYHGLTYSIVDGNVAGKFKIDSSSGLLKTNDSLDREADTQYILNVMVQDNGTAPARTAHAVVIVNVVDVSDHKPMFRQSQYNATVYENIDKGTTVLTVKATDNDKGVNAEIRYYIIGGDGAFRVTEDGSIVVNGSLDYEAKEKYEFQVIAEESLATTKYNDSTAITIFVQDVNEYNPVFNKAQYITVIEDTATPGSPVVQVNATDDDRFYSKLTYSIVHGNSGGVFQINSTTGWISVTDAFKAETTSQHILTIRAADNGISPRTAEVLAVININETRNASFLLQDVYDVTVLENVLVGSTILKLNIRDAYDGTISVFAYEVVGGNGDFSVSSLGEIQVKQALDYETKSTYNFTVVVTETQPPRGLAANATINIVVFDVNEFNPKFAEDRYQGNVSEGATVGTRILQVSASDQDRDYNVLTYSITHGNNGNNFTINGTSGEIRTATSLDREKKEQFILTVRAQDNGPSARTSEVVVIVDILDINDHPPLFLMPNYNSTVFENVPIGTTVLTVKTSDLDQSDSSLTYSLIGADDKFAVNSAGAIFVNGSLDYETVASYNFQVVAEELAPNSHLRSNATICIEVLDVNEFNPEFNQTIYSAEVKENEAIGTSVLTVSATDQDKSFNVLTYSIIAGNDGGNFSINNMTGELRISRPLDRETSHQFVLTIRAEDNGVPPRTSEVTLIIGVSDVNEHGPVFTMSYYNASVSEHADIGATVLVLQALDQDVTRAKLDYQLGSQDAFRIETHYGLGFVIVNKELDYEQNRSYSFMVYAIELTAEKRNTSVMVNITILDENDNRPVFTNSSYTVTVTEGKPAGTTVLNVTANDADSEAFGPIRFEIIEGDPLGNFSIDPSTGVLKTASILDHEVGQIFVLVIEAKDSGVPSLSETATVTVHVTDHNEVGPVFVDLPYTAVVYENTAVDTVVLTVQAVDKDKGKNGEFAYSIVGVDGLFKITKEGNLGYIKVDGSLDYEKNKTFVFYVVAKETGSVEKLESNTTVMVTVNDVNDNPPVFENSLYDMKVGEFTAPPISVGNVKATDKDSGAFGDVTYFIIHGDGNGNFTINNETGEIMTGGILNREILDRYVLTVEARDGGSPPRTSVTSVVVAVTDKNELPPVFQDTPYEENLAENEDFSDHPVLRVKAIDPDLMKIKYKLEPTGEFTIDEATGDIKVTGNFDREKKSLYNLTVTAIDHGGLNTSEYVIIRVTDTNDNTPQFLNIPYKAVVPDNTTTGIVIMTVSATDEDEAHNGDIVYSLLGAEGKFSINQTTGKIIVSSKLDTQLKSTYKLEVIATDRGIPQAKVNSTTVLINVTDSSNSAPKFESVAYVGEIDEGLANRFVVNVKANDLDDGILGKFTYIITGGNTYNAFRINSTGSVISAMALDYENDTQRSFDLSVTVSDGGGLTDTTQVRITVLDVNDNAPALVNIPSPAEVNISDNVPAGTLLFALQAQDLDSGSNKEIEFLVLSSSDNLTVDQATGIIKAKTILLHSVAPSILLSVYARDKGNPSMSSATHNITFNLIPNPSSDPFVLPSLTEVSVFENISIDDVIATVNASLTADSFSILFEFPAVGHFKISKNGTISLAKPLNRESVDAYSVLVKAMKAGQQALGYVSITVLDVNDARPEFLFDIYKGQIKEDVMLGTSVLQVMAVDEDEQGTVVYSITSGNSKGVFNISSTGEIRIAKLPDYENTTFFNLTVTASDGVQTSSSFVEITIIDVNDNSPMFQNSSYSVTVPEDTPGGTSILKVTANDADGDTVFYSIAGDDGKFTIDSITGVITTTADLLDYEKQTSFNLTITAKDNGGLQTSVSLIVNLTNSNDNKPVFGELSYNVTIAENYSGTLPVAVNAIDADSGISGQLTYSIVGSSVLFTVDPITGAINTTVPVDIENDAFVVDDNCRGVTILTLKATDGGSPPLSSTAAVTIFVTDVNDNKPVFSKSSYHETVAEFHTGEILQVEASDKDCGENSEIVYSFTSDNGSVVFHLNETTGSITAKISLNESLGTYFLNVSALNERASPKLQSNVIVTISVVQNKNYPPVFDKTKYFFNIFENATIGSSLGSVSATDLNKDKRGVFIYSIQNPGYAIPFDIDPETGTITLVRKLDRETKGNYTLIVVAKDFGDSPMSDTATVIITVDDINDAIPVFPENTIKSYSVSENITVQSLVCVVQAIDNDAAQYGEPVYVLYSGNEEGYFRIDSSTGEIFLNKSLDRETINVFHLTIRAYNHGSYSSRKRRDLGKTYSEIQIVIDVTDINDSDPKFVQLNYVAGFKESSEPGTNVVTVLAFDPDEGANGKLSYSILRGDGYEAFDINSSTGLITTNANLDQLTLSEVTLEISARDSPNAGIPRWVKENAIVTVYRLPPDPLTTKVTSNTDKETIIEILKNMTGPGYDVIIDRITPDGALSNVTYYIVKNGEFVTENQMIEFVTNYCKENEEICKKYGINLSSQTPGGTEKLLGEDDVTGLEAMVITLGVLIGIGGIFVILLLCCLRRRKRYMPVYEPSELIAPSKAVSFAERPHYFQPDPENQETQEVEIHMDEEVDSADEVGSSSSSESENTEAIAKVHAYMNHALMDDDSSTDSASSDEDDAHQSTLTPHVHGTTSSTGSNEPLVETYNITKI